MKKLLAVAVAALTCACSKPAVEEVETKAAAPVTTLTLAPQTLEGVVTATGVVNAAPGADWTITAPEHARIAEMPKAEGDRVAPGDLLVRFDIPSLRTDVATRRGEVASAEAHVQNAQASVTRLTTLVEHGVAAQKELEDAQRDLAEAKAAVAQAQAALQNAVSIESRAVVRATFPGVVARRAHNPGDMVDAAASTSNGERPANVAESPVSGWPSVRRVTPETVTVYVIAACEAVPIVIVLPASIDVPASARPGIE